MLGNTAKTGKRTRDEELWKKNKQRKKTSPRENQKTKTSHCTI